MKENIEQVEKSERPLSPHLQIYRLPLTGMISIVHRVTGVILSLGMLLFVICLMTVAEGPAAFSLFQAFLQSVIGQISLWGWIFAFFFHFCHGIRHLIWDAGMGFQREDMDKFAYLEISLSIATTLVLWAYVTFSN